MLSCQRRRSMPAAVSDCSIWRSSSSLGRVRLAAARGARRRVLILVVIATEFSRVMAAEEVEDGMRRPKVIGQAANYGMHEHFTGACSLVRILLRCQCAPLEPAQQAGHREDARQHDGSLTPAIYSLLAVLRH